MSVAADPVLVHVAALERALHGPSRARRSMLAEVRDGLQDAVAAYREDGLDPHRAATAAVRDFGAVHEVAPLLQEELAARQGRWTSALLAVAFPGMLVAWDLLWSNGVGGVTAPAPPVVGMLARTTDVLSLAVGAAALALLLATFHRGASCRRLTTLIGLTGVLGTVGCAGTTVLMHVAGAVAHTAALPAFPSGLLAYGGTGAVIAVVTRSCVRTLRAARTSVT